MLKRNFTREYLVCLCLMFLITIAFGHSTAIYTITMIAMVLFAYLRFVKYMNFFPIPIIWICTYLTIVPVMIGLAVGQFQDVPMANVSVLLPFVFATYRVEEGKEYKGCIVIAAIVILVDLLRSRIPVLSELNVNAYSFLMFISLSAIFILVRLKVTPLTVLLLLYAGYILTRSGSRNALVVYLVVAALSLVPYKLLANKVVYRVVYIISLGFQCVSKLWFEFVENSAYWSDLFYSIVEPYVDKAWGIESRVETYTNVSSAIWDQNLFTLLFGNGRAFKHAHNGFYQTTYLYGLVGFVLLMVLYIMIFEMGLKVIRAEKNGLIVGCFVCLCGMFLLQGADVFLLGCKSCVVLPFLLAGIIVRKALFPALCVPEQITTEGKS